MTMMMLIAVVTETCFITFHRWRLTNWRRLRMCESFAITSRSTRTPRTSHRWTFSRTCERSKDRVFHESRCRRGHKLVETCRKKTKQKTSLTYHYQVWYESAYKCQTPSKRRADGRTDTRREANLVHFHLKMVAVIWMNLLTINWPIFVYLLAIPDLPLNFCETSRFVPPCGRLSWPAVWSTFVRTII